MNIHLIDLLYILAAYLLGSISSAILVCKLMRLPDPRSQGSNNPGATNVLRIGGKKAALLTLLGDNLKGFLPVFLAVHYQFSAELVALIGLAAFCGHLFPLFFGFKGGKGVATAFGVYFGLYWLIGLIILGIWLLMAALFRYSSLAALTAMACSPLVVWYFFPSAFAVTVYALMVLMLIGRHHANIKKLLAGEESRIGKKTPPPGDSI
ncbi:MAG: glycerol-3-phosphate 1-O-acyltransferase PlsY [gamma proteobacterium symbiont of Bathyaustriella thionipta]|nr:glycerol-3-phosphate 1-O-acyltransferase PlsY [gamma proteobacterium symbiont of Bathyaustriella thionipta]